MLECASCGRLYPEVAGAPSQVCPHCGAEHVVGAADAPRVHADPVGALQQAWSIARRHYAVLLLLWLPALALELAIALGTGAYERAQGFPTDPSLMTTSEQMRWLGVVLPLNLLALAVRLAMWTFIGAYVLDRAVGGARLARWRALVGVALGAGVVLTFAYVAGVLMLVVGFFVMLHWFLYVPAFLADGTRGVGAAFEASRRFARERRTHGFTALVVLVGGFALAAEFAASSAPGVAGQVAPALVSWLAGPLAPLLAASYLAVVKRAAPSDAPLQSAQAERATTTCPRCSTLIPYTRSESGSASDVTCPSCGYSGRVL